MNYAKLAQYAKRIHPLQSGHWHIVSVPGEGVQVRKWDEEAMGPLPTAEEIDAWSPPLEELDKAKSRKRAIDWDNLRDELFAENRARLRAQEFTAGELVAALDAPEAQAVFSALRQLAFEVAIARIAALANVEIPVFDEDFRERWAAKLTAIL